MDVRSLVWIGLATGLLAQTSFAFGEEVMPDQKLSIKAQFTYGMMGAARSNQFLHDEVIFIRHESRGLATDPKTNKCDISTEITVVANDGSPQKALTDFENSVPYLGGGVFTAGSLFKLPELQPGSHSIVIKVHDRITNNSAETTLPFKILPQDKFGARNVVIAQDTEKRFYANSFTTTGEILYVHGEIVNYQADMDQVDLVIEMKVLDEQKENVFETSFTEQKGAKASRFSDTQVPYQFHVKLYTARPGRYQIALTVHDLLSGQHHQQKMPLIVLDPFEQAP